MVWVWPTMPKRGAAEIAMRRSRSSLRPVISACTGAWKPSAAALAGMSCTRPSVIRKAPATRSTGTSDSAEDSAPNRLRAVGFAVGLAGLDHAHFEPLDLLQAVDQRLLRLRGLLGAVAEILARALVDHDGGHRRQRLAVLAGEGRIGERQQDQRQRRDAHRRAARAAEQQQRRDHDDGARARSRARAREPAA